MATGQQGFPGAERRIKLQNENAKDKKKVGSEPPGKSFGEKTSKRITKKKK